MAEWIDWGDLLGAIAEGVLVMEYGLLRGPDGSGVDHRQLDQLIDAGLVTKEPGQAPAITAKGLKNLGYSPRRDGR